MPLPVAEPEPFYSPYGGRVNIYKGTSYKEMPVAYQVQTTTRSGMPLLLQGFADGDPTIKEGYTVDMLEAHGENGPVGYLKMSYMDSRKLERFFPTPVHYAVRELGVHTGLQKYLTADESI